MTRPLALNTVYSMQRPAPLQLGDSAAGAAAEAIRAMIGRGDFVAGERINEVRLAASLGVSRTPLREALNRLLADGSIEAQRGRGFSVPRFSAAELREAYEMRPILDCAALERAGLPNEARLARLKALNERFEKTVSVSRRIDIDDAFHLALVAPCGNDMLIRAIEQVMARTRRYEFAYLAAAETLMQSGAEHRRIIDALEAGDLAAAIEALRDNLSSGLEPMLRWLKKNLKES